MTVPSLQETSPHSCPVQQPLLAAHVPSVREPPGVVEAESVGVGGEANSDSSMGDATHTLKDRPGHTRTGECRTRNYGPRSSVAVFNERFRKLPVAVHFVDDRAHTPTVSATQT